MWGFQKIDSWTSSNAIQGLFAEDGKTRQEFMSSIRHNLAFH